MKPKITAPVVAGVLVSTTAIAQVETVMLTAFRSTSRKPLGLAAAIFLGLSASLFSQEWTTGYFSTNNGYIGSGSSLDGQATNAPSSAQWQTTDPYNPLTDRGSSSSLQFLDGWTLGAPPGFGGANNSMRFGGFGAVSGVYFPGITNPSLYRSFTNPMASGSAFIIDFALIGPSSSLSGFYPENDTFAFNLTDTNNNSLARLTLTNFSPTTFGIGWQQNGTNVVADGSTFKALQFTYGSLFRLTASLSGTSLNVDVDGLVAQSGGPGVGITNYAVVNSTNLISGGDLSGALTEEDFERIALDWDLASGDTNNPGANNLLVTTMSVVPEPSSLMLLTLAGVGALAVYARRRRSS